MLCLNDNTPYSVKADELCAYDALRAIANRPVKDIVDSHGNNLLIYPHSFRQSKDKIGSQSILSWQTNWKGGKCDGADISTENVVGFIGIDDCDITIKSRFSENTGEDYFLHYMLQKALCINIFNLSHSSKPETLFDFLLFLFPKHLNDALMQGIYKDYRHNSYNDANIRGVIDINRHINANIPFNGRVAYHTRELSHDNRVTQLIRHTIEHIATTDIGKKLLENDAETHASVSRIIAATPGYRRQDRSKIIKDNLKPLSHPYYTRYKPLQQICMRILNHDRLKYGPNGDRIYGILFDISYLWEEYLFTLLRPLGFKHPDNRSNRGGIYLSECNHFIRFPDFYDSETVIDAKYKLNIDTRNDINQMLTYMYTLKSRHGVIIQPAVDCTQIQPFRLNGHGKDHGATLYISSLRIPRAAVNYNAFKAAMKTSENEFKTILTSVFRENDIPLP